MSEKSEMEQSAILLLLEPKGELVVAGNTGGQEVALPEGLNLPKLITDAGDKATLRFINFFTAEIENDNTRMAYYRAVRQFDAWCEKRGAGLHQLQPFIVAAYTKELKETRHPQTVKQHLAALRMLFDNLVVGPGHSKQSGGERARPEVQHQERQDAGADPGRNAEAHP